MNIDNFKLVLDKIESDPDCWNQTAWHCGTKHCFGGWAQILSGAYISDKTVRCDARIFLGIDKNTADYLFASHRSIEDFKKMIAINPDGYDRDGYKDGYDQDGYDRNGYDLDGYDLDGLDKNNKPRTV